LHAERNVFNTLKALDYLKDCDLPALRSLQIDGNDFDPSHEYKVKQFLEKFRSVTHYKKYKGIFIHV